MTIVIRKIRQAWENCLEHHSEGSNIPPVHCKWYAPNPQIAELALGVVATIAPVEQALYITDDRQGIEVCLQICEVQAVDGH